MYGRRSQPLAPPAICNQTHKTCVPSSLATHLSLGDAPHAGRRGRMAPHARTVCHLTPHLALRRVTGRTTRVTPHPALALAFTHLSLEHGLHAGGRGPVEHLPRGLAVAHGHVEEAHEGGEQARQVRPPVDGACVYRKVGRAGALRISGALEQGCCPQASRRGPCVKEANRGGRCGRQSTAPAGGVCGCHANKETMHVRVQEAVREYGSPTVLYR